MGSSSEKDMKYDGGKPRFDLVPWLGVEGAARVMAYGAKKYRAHSWRNAVRNPIPRYYSALMRHLSAFFMGEAVDPESGMPHLDHAVANLLMLRELVQDQDFVSATGREDDDE